MFVVVRLVEWIVSFGRVLALLVRHLVCRRRLIREPPWERRQVLEACVERGRALLFLGCG